MRSIGRMRLLLTHGTLMERTMAVSMCCKVQSLAYCKVQDRTEVLASLIQSGLSRQQVPFRGVHFSQICSLHPSPMILVKRSPGSCYRMLLIVLIQMLSGVSSHRTSRSRRRGPFRMMCYLLNRHSFEQSRKFVSAEKKRMLAFPMRSNPQKCRCLQLKKRTILPSR